MSTLALRPTFDLDLDIPRDQAAHRLGAIIGAGDGHVVGQTVGHHLMLSIRKEDRHFWSPWLTLEITDAGDGACRVHARFHPHPSLWTAYMLGYLALATAASFAAMFGCVQLTLDAAPWALWIVVPCAAIALAMWIAAKIGQGLARDQMDLLATAVRRAAVENMPPAPHQAH